MNLMKRLTRRDVYDLHRASNGQIRYGDALFVNDAVRSDVIDAFTEEP